MHQALRWLRLLVGLFAAALALLGSLEVWSAVAYLAGLHGSLGAGLLPALCAVWALFAIVVLPPALWGLWPWLRRAAADPRRLGAGLAGAFAVFAGATLLSHDLAQLTPGPAAPTAVPDREIERALEPLAGLAGEVPAPSGALPPLSVLAPVACSGPPSAREVTLVATFADTSGQVSSHCVFGPNVDAARVALHAALIGRALRGPLQLEVLSGQQSLGSRHAWLDALKLRPGLDGVCDRERCLMPWQLLAHGFFSTHRPLQLIPDFQFGVSAAAVRRALGASESEHMSGLVRFESRSYVLDLAQSPPRLTALSRLRRRDVVVGRQSLTLAERAAEQHIVSAQLPSGKFRYTLDPMSGHADTESVSLARQGGTTLVLCELGRKNAAVRQAIQRSLEGFRAFERRAGERVALTTDAAARSARLGESTLPLVSLLACHARENWPLPESAGGLARFVLALQRPDGGFWPSLDLSSGQVEQGPEPLYAVGQALLALVLIERMQRDQPSSALPPLELVHAAVERAMTHVAERYWSHPLRDFFFLEENWHCLAAREALSVHRHPGYEDFCLDYVRFKSRLILEHEQGIDADFDGGFGFGNVVPPHNTGAAGTGEALAAAIAIQRVRGQAAGEEERALARVLGFLLRQQWSTDNCALCATREVIGGMSEHTHSAITRIDFAQHAWAALGHGGRALGLLE